MIAQNDISLLTQYIAWMMALLQLILGLYVLVINAWKPPIERSITNFLVAILLVVAVDSYATGSLAGANNADQVFLPTLLLSISIPVLPVILLLACVSIFRIELLKPGKRAIKKREKRSLITNDISNPLRWGIFILIVLPLLLTTIDILLGNITESKVPRLWFSGIDSIKTYSGGFLPGKAFVNGLLSPLVESLNLFLITLITLVFLVSEALTMRRSSHPENTPRRVLIWFLILTLLPVLAISAARLGISNITYILFSNSLITVAFAYASFHQITVSTTVTGSGLEIQEKTGLQQQPEERTTRASFQARLIGTTIVVVLPLLAAMGLMLIQQARRQLEVNAGQTLAKAEQSMGEQVLLWLDLRIAAIQNVANSPAIRSMDPDLQKPMLESTAVTYSDFFLISTLDLDGTNIARSDNEPGRDYSNEAWFQKVSTTGQPAYQPLAGRDIWKTDLVMAIPIRSAIDGPVLGYLVAHSSLDQISKRFQDTRLGEQGFAILVDEQNRLLAHPDWAQEIVRSSYGLQEMNNHPPIAALPSQGAIVVDQDATLGTQGMFRFSGQDGYIWQAALARLDNGWGLVVQQREDELLAPIATFQRIALIVLVAGFAMLIPLMLLTVRNSITPIQKLTNTARLIAGGNLEELAPLEITTEPDEIGLLAGTFNSMTLQLRALIGNLEARVAERTQTVQRRAVQLQVTAEVARDAASIRVPEDLMRNIVNLISERFSFYHAGIFLVQGTWQASEATVAEERVNTEGYAVLHAASSEGGQRMLARRHRLKIGPAGSGVGIVGYVAYAGEPRIALDVGSDAVFFNNPDLPLTRSEMALPLMVATEQHGAAHQTRRRVIGVLDVQSTQEAAFSQEDLEILQILADQVAVALESARLLSESRSAFNQLEKIYGERILQSWQERLSRIHTASESAGEITYTYNRDRKQPVQEQRVATEQKTPTEESGIYGVSAPIELRGVKLGQLSLQRNRNWSQQELVLIHETLDQVALAVENARLLDEIQQRATQEELVNRMVAATQRSLDLQTVMHSLVQEVSQTIPVDRVRVKLVGKDASQTEAMDEKTQDERIEDRTGGKDA